MEHWIQKVLLPKCCNRPWLNKSISQSILPSNFPIYDSIMLKQQMLRKKIPTKLPFFCPSYISVASCIHSAKLLDRSNRVETHANTQRSGLIECSAYCDKTSVVGNSHCHGISSSCVCLASLGAGVGGAWGVGRICNSQNSWRLASYNCSTPSRLSFHTELYTCGRTRRWTHTVQRLSPAL